jgi:hypothetical protein
VRPSVSGSLPPLKDSVLIGDPPFLWSAAYDYPP